MTPRVRNDLKLWVHSLWFGLVFWKYKSSFIMACLLYSQYNCYCFNCPCCYSGKCFLLHSYISSIWIEHSSSVAMLSSLLNALQAFNRQKVEVSHWYLTSSSILLISMILKDDSDSSTATRVNTDDPIVPGSFSSFQNRGPESPSTASTLQSRLPWKLTHL